MEKEAPFCPTCKRYFIFHDPIGSRIVSAEIELKPGAIGMCSHCGKWWRFNNGLTEIYEPTEMEKQLASDKLADSIARVILRRYRN
jgi:RNase P subunit RPR2